MSAISAGEPSADDDDGFEGVRWAVADTSSELAVASLHESLTSVVSCFEEMKASEYGQFLQVVELWRSKFAK